MQPITTNSDSITRDVFQRPLQDLRISVIDRCNFRCTYCMPEKDYHQHYTFLKEKEWLTFGEIIRVSKLFTQLGVTKIRLTGGEPLLRPGLAELIHKLTQTIRGEDLALTTNGALLEAQARELKQAGLKRLTVSLDTLDEKIFRQMNGQRASVADVLRGIETAQNTGFESIKINVVVERGVNDHTVLELVKYFRGTGHIVRFIEYMDVGNCNHWDQTKVVPSREILELIRREFPLQTLERNYNGEVAQRYAFSDGKGELGFITSVTQPFCADCTRARISTDGKLYTCLFATQGTDLRNPLREGATDEELLSILKNAWQKRNDKYSENRSLFRSLKDQSPKVEMFQIGG